MIEQDTGIIKLNNLWTLTCCLNEVIYIYIYIYLVKSNKWSIINATFWLVELLLGYML